jgi:hypothetical protein
VHIGHVLKKIGKDVDIIWSFDLSHTIPLSSFPKKCIKIFMPVDEPLFDVAIQSAKGADILFSVTKEIVEKYHAYSIPKYFINHGVSEGFINRSIVTQNNNPIRIGLSGNMLRPDIDHDTLSLIIRSNKNVQFDIWGTTNPALSNLVSVRDAKTKPLQFVEMLSTLPNVVLHGQVRPEQLAEELKKVDGFLICYNLKKDQSRGTNYHKVMEYISTGKVIVSNNITTYKNNPELVTMIESRDNNDDLPALFSKIVSNIDRYNTLELQQKRIEFAKAFAYGRQIEKIGALLDSVHSPKKSTVAS